MFAVCDCYIIYVALGFRKRERGLKHVPLVYQVTD